MTTSKPPTTEYSQEILQWRLATGMGQAGGAKGSLTRAAGRLGSLLQTPSADDVEDITSLLETRKAELVRELQLLQTELTKLILQNQRQAMELEQSPPLLQDEIEAERSAVMGLRSQLGQASSTVRCQQEYESLAKLATSRHPVARRVLQQKLDATQTEYQATKEQLGVAKQHVRIRESQFQNLMQTMLDLKQSLTEPLVLEEGEQVGDEEEDDHDMEQEKEEGEESGQEAEPMETEPALAPTKEEDEEEELYGDL